MLWTFFIIFCFCIFVLAMIWDMTRPDVTVFCQRLCRTTVGIDGVGICVSLGIGIGIGVETDQIFGWMFGWLWLWILLLSLIFFCFILLYIQNSFNIGYRAVMVGYQGWSPILLELEIPYMTRKWFGSYYFFYFGFGYGHNSSIFIKGFVRLLWA